jgi:hypothetical protein
LTWRIEGFLFLQANGKTSIFKAWRRMSYSHTYIQKLLEANNGVIRQEIQAQGQTVRKDLRQEIQSAKTEVINAVRKAEDEVIETLRDTTGVVKSPLYGG